MSVHGLVGINKPSGFTSAQIINQLQQVFKNSPMFRDHIYDNEGKLLKRKRFQQNMGHGGTLDPLATGVLVVGIGAATKRLGEFLHCSKEYEATALSGGITDTYDCEGRILFRKPYQHITREKVLTALSQFRGEIMQKPPIYSALKMNGKPLYDYAREGKELPKEIAARSVTVESIELTDWNTEHNWPEPEEVVIEDLDSKNAQIEKVELAQHGKPNLVDEADSRPQQPEVDQHETTTVDTLTPSSKRLREEAEVGEDTHIKLPDDHLNARPTAQRKIYDKPPAFSIRMTVSSGTYVRSIIHDLGVALGSGAYMVELQRTRQGQFALKQGNVLEWGFWEQDGWEEKIKTLLEQSHRGKSIPADEK
ncbi:putative tRNA pseudouridine synthase 4 [Neolecta irregularis DAH-3]|uniref:tRNA pseudouridine(55) synthase n=1 Tax=Neolecta irregularis (strain DAH-3) TaxID=1198029 RepID=A0A1U7LNT3_NEOID|nr:putative tRNA pseudouridine synthase 4 [Neolecta irregularis DAH-3]|eukprot:OLL24315.1 putative tRNA pseudouridine synthase 4 [Neolecta irregularis DAH-3]